MILAMDQEKKRIKAFNPQAEVRVVSIDSIDSRQNVICGSAAKFFREYQK